MGTARGTQPFPHRTPWCFPVAPYPVTFCLRRRIPRPPKRRRRKAPAIMVTHDQRAAPAPLEGARPSRRTAPRPPHRRTPSPMSLTTPTRRWTSRATKASTVPHADVLQARSRARLVLSRDCGTVGLRILRWERTFTIPLKDKEAQTDSFCNDLRKKRCMFYKRSVFWQISDLIIGTDRWFVFTV